MADKMPTDAASPPHARGAAMTLESRIADLLAAWKPHQPPEQIARAVLALVEKEQIEAAEKRGFFHLREWWADQEEKPHD